MLGFLLRHSSPSLGHWTCLWMTSRRRNLVTRRTDRASVYLGYMQCLIDILLGV